MCLVISLVTFGLAYMFYEDGNMQGFYINISLAIFFLILMIRNILKVKKEKNN